jgi:chemotaxis methyl-accepting protein methylase
VAPVLARGESRLRIWSAGCASGEEPYTLALMFAFGETPKRCEPAILATDADPHLLRRARYACYHPTSLRALPQTWRTAFEKSDDQFCLSPEYRTPVRFLAQDIRRRFRGHIRNSQKGKVLLCIARFAPYLTPILTRPGWIHQNACTIMIVPS